MAIYQATFINNESKSGYQKNESRTIEAVSIDGKIRVTSPGAWPGPEAIFYDSKEDFLKDWQLLKPEGFNGQK